MLFKHTLAFFLLTSIGISSCEKKQVRGASVAVDLSEADSLAVKIYHFPIFEDVEILGQLDLDTVNYGLMQVELCKPLMSYITINGTSYELYLEPGYNLKLSKDTSHITDSILFEGDGALVNNYINHVAALVTSQRFFGYDHNTFTKKYDSLTVAVDTFTRSYFDRFPVQKDDLQLLIEIKKMKLLSLRTSYAHRAHSDALMDQMFRLQQGEPMGKMEMIGDFQIYFTDIPFDTAYLRNEIPDYREILYNYLMQKHLSVTDIKLLEKPYMGYPTHVRARWPRQVNTVIKDESYPKEIKEYLIAADLRYWMESEGITPEIDSIFDEFKLEFKGSVYTGHLQETYDQQVTLLPGTIAPDFRGRTAGGKLISLSDFKGKVVYVDVWATWCGPCVEQIPYAKKLHSAFQDDKVIFLNVSVDDDVEAWKRMLAKEKDWLGTHIILDQQEVELLSKNYKVNGYPKYFLIDQMGEIVSTRAGTPSSSTINKQITSLLTSN